MDALTELKLALQPLVDASLRHPKLAAHLPRLSAAVEALETEVGGSAGKPRPVQNFPDDVPARRSARTAAALDAIEKQRMPVAQAAREFGVAASTLFRARATKPSPSSR